MSDNQGTVKFATYGPNRGQTLNIGSYQFVDGFCEVPQKDVSAATRILCRYHDVCLSGELDEKIVEYNAQHGEVKTASTPPPAPETKTEPPAEPPAEPKPAEPKAEPKAETLADTGEGETGTGEADTGETDGKEAEAKVAESKEAADNAEKTEETGNAGNTGNTTKKYQPIYDNSQ